MKNSRITVMYLVFGFLSILLIGFVLFNSLSAVMMEDALSNTEASVSGSGKYLEVYIDRIKTMSNLIASDRDVVDYFGRSGSEEDAFYEERIDALIGNALSADGSLKSIILISKDGKIFSNESNLDMSMSEDMMKEDWYVEAIRSDMPVLTSARMQKFSMDKDLWVISLSQEIMASDGNNIGVVVIDIPYTSFEDYLMELHLGEDGYAFILNEENEVVFHKDTDYYIEDTLKRELIGLKNEKEGYRFGSDLLINRYRMENTDWILVGVCSVDAIGVIQRQILETVILGSVLLLVGVVITGFLLRKLTAEIRQQQQDIHHYEMNALYSQINPHFLYNTLDTIVWMAEFGQSDEVVKTTKSLARFFRLSLNRGEELTRLEDEIEHARQYLYIQKKRYQEKLEYSFEVEDGLEEVIVPKIILQPVVENSIYHGIRDLDGDGRIIVKVVGDGQDIIVTVSDNGVGFDMEGASVGMVESLEEEMAELPKSSKTRLGGVGLDNVHKRIRLFCGEGYGLSIDSKVNEGTVVTLRLCRGTDVITVEE